MLILQARKLLLLSQSALASFEKAAAPSVFTFSVLFRTNYDALFRLIITLLLLLLFFAVYVVIHQSHYVLHELGDIDVFFSTRLKVHESVLIRDFDRFALEYGPLSLLRIGQIDLVSHQHLGHRGVRRIPVYGVDPRAHVLKRLPLRQVERDDHAVRLPVELLRDRVKPLLPRRVPNLHIHFRMLITRVSGLDAVYAERLYVRLLELVVAKAIL